MQFAVLQLAMLLMYRSEAWSMHNLRLVAVVSVLFFSVPVSAAPVVCGPSWKKTQNLKIKKLKSRISMLKSVKARQSASCRAKIGSARTTCLQQRSSNTQKAVSLKEKIADIRGMLNGCLTVNPAPTQAPSATFTAAPIPSATVAASPTNAPILASQVSQWGITWNFDKQYRIGHFANGDYWVAPESPGGSVVITSISPAFTGLLHGWQVNPVPGADHSLDARVQGWKSALLPSLPLIAHAGDSIVKAISNPASCVTVDTRCLQTAAVLTVLGAAPLGDGAGYFRPPYVGTEKPLISLDEIHLDRLPSLPAPSGVAVPSFANIKTTIERVQLEHSLNWIRQLRPVDNLPGYGADISARNSEVSMRLLLNDPLEDKMPTLIAYLQYGIDLYHIVKLGGKFPSAGGHGQGRLPALAFTGALLDHAGIASMLAAAQSEDFGEAGATYMSAVAGKALYGEDWYMCSEYQYWSAMYTHGTAQTCPDPYGYIDGGTKPGAVYQTCCSTSFWRSSATVFNTIPEMKELWNDQAFFEYIARWKMSGTSTNPDPCAPAIGFCTGGPNQGAACNTATAEVICTGQKPNGAPATCDADMTLYGVAFGPDGAGSCILDSDPSDGIGRFPQQDGSGADLHWGQSPFQIKMEEMYG